jgi:choline dehydrogenase-like flavoprotein
MFTNFQEINHARPLEADLCIVGTGAAGITLAREFIGHPTKVLLIESGGLALESATTELYRGEMAPQGKFHRGIHEGRARVFGGTTILWGGQALPLSKIDFEQRSWVSNSGWPFRACELEPYHQRARDILGLRDVEFDTDIHKSFGIIRPGFNPEIIECIYSCWSPRPNFASTYRQCLTAAENVCVVLKANVTQILLASDGSRVEGLELKSLNGKTGTARAKAYVICCGGIETPRLLLASSRVQPEGIGNSHDLVGRYFQDHLSVRWAGFVPSDRQKVDELFNSFFRSRVKYYPLLAAGEPLQRREHILNISAAVLFENSPDSGLEISKRLYGAVRNRHPAAISFSDAVKLLTQSPEVIRSIYRIFLQHRSYAHPRAPLYLGSTIEQEPNFHSRVTLDTRVDALGMPRVILDWKLTPLVGKTLVTFAHGLRMEFERIGLGRVNLYPWLLTESDEWIERIHDVFHHMGTTRMHDDPRYGVVDAACRVHGLENLYIGSSSVFPTGGHSNPTFTLLLLCFRLADRLKKSLV